MAATAVSLSGTQIRINFGTELRNDFSLLNPFNYQFTTVAPGAAPASTLTVTITQYGPFGGVLAVTLMHTGTTLGGQYRIVGNNLRTHPAGILFPLTVFVYTLGDAPTATVTPLSGTELLVQFSKNMLPATSLPPGSLSPSDVANYQFTSSYPVSLTPLAVEFPYLGSLAKARLTVQGMTSVPYTALIGPATAINYPGTYLPNLTTSWRALQIGTGVSRIYNNHLRLDRGAGVNFGWEWQDTTGRVAPDTTFQASLTFNPSGASFVGVPVDTTIAEMAFQDGPVGVGTRIVLQFRKSPTGSYQLRLQSGTLNATFSVDWYNGGTKTFSIIRNRKGNFYTVRMANTVITNTLISNATGVSTGAPGASFVLVAGPWSVTNLDVWSLVITSSTTLFSSTWNFLHGGTVYFTGSGALGRSTLLTKRGPLVKSWGDGTPATKNDVTVRVAGTPVAVADVNPYIGQITLAAPIPLLPAGDPQADVKVDYIWFPSPAMEFAALDTPGLVYDQYVIPASTAKVGLTPSAQPSQIGAAGSERFPFSSVLGPLVRRFPQYTSHRYLGFQREYTSVLDSPTTLLFDMVPGRASVPGFEYPTPGLSVTYEATGTPPADSNPWRLTGTDFGQVNVGLGTYTAIDAKIGTYDPANPQTVVYDRPYTVYPASLNVVARFMSVEGTLFSGTVPVGADTDTTTPDGVFTGIGFGTHDGLGLALVGLLKVNGVYHVGLLQVGEEPHLLASWDLGPKTTGTASVQNTLTIPTAEVPVGMTTGTRFQVLTGVQAGVYTITSVVKITSGTVLTFTPNLPTYWDTVGAKYLVLTFEVRHAANPFTYRITRTLAGSYRAEVSGEISGVISTPTTLPNPADTSLLIPQDGEGHFFWGSLNRAAASKSIWNFVRYGLTPAGATLYAQDVVVNTEMNVLPEQDGWAPVGNFGTLEVQTLPQSLLLRATSGDSTLNFVESYERFENFLSSLAIFDYRATFRLDDGVLGAGDLAMEVGDGTKVGRLVTLLYREAATGDNTTYRRLIQLPQISLPGILPPATEGWTVSGTPVGQVRGAYFETTLTSTASGGTYRKNLSTTGIDFTDSYGRIVQARFRVDSWSTQTGILVQVDFQDGTPAGRQLFLTLNAGQVELRDNWWIGQLYPFTWDDGEFHTYRIIIDVAADTVVLSIDDQVQLPTLTVSGMAPGLGEPTNLTFGTSQPGVGASVVSWHSVSLQCFPPADAKRTLGVWKGGNLDDINSYEVPRTDNSTAPNSWQLGPVQPGMDPAPVVVEMDWRSDLMVRMYRDPEWGLAVFRPDLPPPPYYTGTNYLTESTEPTLAWINVEYSQLPEATKAFGYASFGSLDSRSVCQQRWDYVRYRVLRSPSEERISPSHMVLDQYNVISSGELLRDVTLEQVAVTTISLTQLSLLPTHLYAEDIYRVEDGTTTFMPGEWAFDSLTQTLTLLEDTATATPRQFSSAHATVTVTFLPGKPITNTYLAAQPLLDGMTLLNEGTPPVPKSQIGVSTLAERMGLPISPYFLSYHAEQPGTLYDELEFIEVQDSGETGLIKSICEGMLSPNTEVWEESGGEPIYSDTGTGAPLGGAGACANLKETGTYVGRPQGGYNLWFQGFREQGYGPHDPLWSQDGQNFLRASGGHYFGGNANEALVYPTWPALSPAVPDSGHLELEVEWGFDGLYLEPDALVNLTDSAPPTEPAGWANNPPGTPGADGSALLLFQYTLLSPPVPGPWSGDPTLLPVPDYGLVCPAAPVGGSTVVSLFTQLGGLVATFAAVVGPPGAPGDWSVTMGSWWLNLRVAINTHPASAPLVVATADISLGVPMVTVKALVPLVLPDFYYFTTSNPLEAHLGVAMTVA